MVDRALGNPLGNPLGLARDISVANAMPPPKAIIGLNNTAYLEWSPSDTVKKIRISAIGDGGSGGYGAANSTSGGGYGGGGGSGGEVLSDVIDAEGVVLRLPVVTGRYEVQVVKNGVQIGLIRAYHGGSINASGATDAQGGPGGGATISGIPGVARAGIAGQGGNKITQIAGAGALTQSSSFAGVLPAAGAYLIDNPFQVFSPESARSAGCGGGGSRGQASGTIETPGPGMVGGARIELW